MQRLYNKVGRELLLQKLEVENTPRVTLSFYKYHPIENTRLFRDHLYIMLSSHQVFGRVYIAQEGINAQISVPDENFEAFKSDLESISFLNNCRLNKAIQDNGKSFFKLTIKERKYILADGLSPNSYDLSKRGKHLKADEFNEMMKNNETVVIDMRNHYESEVGRIEGAYFADVETFIELLPIAEQIVQDHQGKDIVLYCTGGIRCEKASAYFISKGLKGIHQLDGGIIEYTRQCDKSQKTNHFKGKNFVFDERLGEAISEDVISRCHQCNSPSATHVNCSNDHCHILFIQCEKCAKKYSNTCSRKCQEFNDLPESEKNALKGSIEFNGTQSSKGRYNALNKDEPLILNK